MNIIECHFEFSGFDDHLVKAGTAVYLWNLCQEFHAAGHQVTGLTAAHGLLPRLRSSYEVTTLDWRLDADIPVRLDPMAWPGHPAQVTLPVSATAHLLRIGGIDVIMLAGGMLDEHTDSFYPPQELEGCDLHFLKPLVFQVVAARFLADTATPGTVIHLHEPSYHYLIPAALRGRGLVLVSTVQTNVPINIKVYGPEVRTLLSYLGADMSLTEGLDDPPLDTPLQQAMRAYLPRTLLYREYPERPGHDYFSMLGLVVRSVAALDFLSRGQLDHAVTQADTPFEQLFGVLAVRRELAARLNRLVVCGCAIGPEWLDVQRSPARREQRLTALGLDPGLPTIYHNGRYSVQHKGQRDMFRALRRLLDAGERCNVLLHCLSPRPLDDPDLAALTGAHPDLVRARTGPMVPAELIDWAAASDLCLFPSKFEMDTFLIAMGEAMACGAVPIATAQQGMRHFGHTFDLDDPAATGLALPRSFRVDDPVLTDAICAGVRRMLNLVRSDPSRIDTLRDRAIAVARQFTWERVAGRFLATFAACAADGAPAPGDGALAGVPGSLAELPPDTPPGRYGTGRLRAGDDGTEVIWRGPPAARVDVVVSGSQPAVVTLQAGHDGCFRGRIPGRGHGHLAMLITRPDGGAVWADLTADGLAVVADGTEARADSAGAKAGRAGAADGGGHA